MAKKEFDTPERVLDEIRALYADPDPDQPYFIINTEADSQAEAEALADEYAHLVENISPLD